MATELAYPRADKIYTVGDIRPMGWARLHEDGAYVDPAGFNASTSLQAIDAKGAFVGDPTDAVSVEVKPDPKDPQRDALKLSIDTTAHDAGRYRWELRVEGTLSGGDTLDVAMGGGYITLVERLEDPA